MQEPILDGHVGSGRHAVLVVWTVWATMLFLALYFSTRFAVRIPCHDDWTSTVPYLTGEQRLTPEFLWSQVNEHRLPLVKLMVLPLVAVTGGCFQAENYLNVAIFGFVAWGMIRLARHLRGWTSLSDILFPLALLHPGHVESFAARLTLNHVLASALTCGVLSVVLLTGQKLSPRRLVFLSLLLLALPLCGANGLPVVLAAAVWLCLVGWLQWREPNAERTPIMLAFALAGLSFGLVCLYFVSFHALGHHQHHANLGRVFSVAATALSTSLAPSQWLLGNEGMLKVVPVPVVVLLTGGLLVYTFLRKPEERLRAVGLALILSALIVVALAMGWGRAGLGETAGYSSRYAAILVPVLLTVFLGWLAFAPRQLATGAQWGLLGLVCLGLPTQFQRGFREGEVVRQWGKSFLRDLRHGPTAEALAQKYAGRLYSTGNHPLVSHYLHALHDRHWEPFVSLRNASNLRSISIAIPPFKADSDRISLAQGWDPHRDFSLDRPWLVQTVRVRVVCPTAELKACWMLHGRNAFSAVERNQTLQIIPSKDEQTVEFLVDDTIDCIHIDSDTAAGEVEIRELTALVPESRAGEESPFHPSAPAIISGRHRTKGEERE